MAFSTAATQFVSILLHSHESIPRATALLFCCFHPITPTYTSPFRPLIDLTLSYVASVIWIFFKVGRGIQFKDVTIQVRRRPWYRLVVSCVMRASALHSSLGLLSFGTTPPHQFLVKTFRSASISIWNVVEERDLAILNLFFESESFQIFDQEN